MDRTICAAILTLKLKVIKPPDERDQIGEPPEIGRLTANALAACIEKLEARIERLER